MSVLGNELLKTLLARFEKKGAIDEYDSLLRNLTRHFGSATRGAHLLAVAAMLGQEASRDSHHLTRGMRLVTTEIGEDGGSADTYECNGRVYVLTRYADGSKRLTRIIDP